MNIPKFIQEVADPYGSDLTLLGLPVALVITMLVQVCKMMRMPTQWSPPASLIIGYLVAILMQFVKDVPLTAATVVSTFLLGVSYALMANGIFATIVGMQDFVRGRNAATTTGVLTVAPQEVPVQVAPSITGATTPPSGGNITTSENVTKADVHIVGPNNPLGG